MRTAPVWSPARRVPGTSLGVAAALTGRPIFAGAAAIEASELLAIPVAEATDAFRLAPDLALALLRELSGQDGEDASGGWRPPLRAAAGAHGAGAPVAAAGSGNEPPPRRRTARRRRACDRGGARPGSHTRIVQRGVVLRPGDDVSGLRHGIRVPADPRRGDASHRPRLGLPRRIPQRGPDALLRDRLPRVQLRRLPGRLRDAGGRRAGGDARGAAATRRPTAARTSAASAASRPPRSH